jgi:hypothetical protein
MLLTLAEVGIAFAGFTGLVGVLGGPRMQVHPIVHHVRFRGMIESALILVLFSIAPLVFGALGLVELNVWRVSSGLLATVWLSQVAIVIRRMRLLPAQFSRIASIPIFGIIAVANVLLLANTAGFLRHHAAAAYLLVLSLLLVLAAILFLRVLVAFVPGRRE